MPPRHRIMLLAAACLLLLAAAGAYFLAVLGFGPTVSLSGSDLVITNKGLPVRHVSLGLSAGNRNFELTVPALPRGITRIPLSRFDPALAADAVSGASVTGTRLGGSFAAYSALRLSPPAHANAAEPDER